MTNASAKILADKYIGRDGGEPVPEEQRPATAAEWAWREHAETVHRFLRTRIKTSADAAAACAAFEQIGKAIAIDEQSAKRRER